MESRNVARSFDAWIDDLVEFEEMQLPSALREMSIADASYVPEASKDIPIITLVAFNGSITLCGIYRTVQNAHS